MKKTTRIVFALVVAVVAVIIVLLIANKGGEGVDLTHDVPNNSIQDAFQMRSVPTYDVIDPAEWSETEKAESSINNSQGKEDTESIVYGVIESGDHHYFATNEEAEDGTFVGIYKYDVETRDWERLYKATLDEDSSYKQLHVLGYVDNKLVIRTTKIDTEAECYHPFMDGAGISEDLVTLDIDNPYNAFEETKLPKEETDQFVDEYDHCVMLMESTE